MNIWHRIFPVFGIVCLSMFAVSACASAASPDKDCSDAHKLNSEVEFSFHIVRGESTSAAAMRLAMEGKTPPGAMYRSYANQEGGLILEKRTRLNVDCIESAEAGKHPVSNKPIVNFKFDDPCTKIFADMTAKSIGKRFAVVLDGEILTAPTINSPITGGAGFIESGFSEIDAQKLAHELNAAATHKKAK